MSRTRPGLGAGAGDGPGLRGRLLDPWASPAGRPPRLRGKFAARGAPSDPDSGARAAPRLRDGSARLGPGLRDSKAGLGEQFVREEEEGSAAASPGPLIPTAAA